MSHFKCIPAGAVAVMASVLAIDVTADNGRTAVDGQEAALVLGGARTSPEPIAVGCELDVAGTVAVCAGSNYSGCGGGACGTKMKSNLSGIGNREYLSSTIPCSEKTCGTGKASCGSFNDHTCV